MASGLVDVMKRASMDAVANSQPCDLRFGTVTCASPLKIRVTNQLILPESLLTVPQHLTNYSVEVDVDWMTELVEGGKDEDAFEEHAHPVTGKKKLKIYNALKVGDKVALLRKQGGQSYYVLDRMG